MADLESKLRPLAESLLEPGEELLGCCVATQSSTFSGRLVAIAVTRARVVVQGVGRRWEAKGDPLSLTPELIADASAEGGAGDWMTLSTALVDHASVALELRTHDAQKLKLVMMRAEGLGFSALGGGEIQREGVGALGEWFARNAPRA